jgi:hypothetical protein
MGGVLSTALLGAPHWPRWCAWRGAPGDEEELGFFKNVDEEPAALEVLDFLYPLQVDEVVLSPGGGDEGDAARALVQSKGAKDEEVAEVSHRRFDVDPCLAGLGEDR